MTAIDQDQTQISFHEATITGITYVGTTISLKLEDVLIDGVQKAAEVAIEGVSAALRDGAPIADLRMEKEDGEVLTLRKEGADVVLVLEWNNFADRSQTTVVYTFKGPNVALQLKSPA